MKKEKNPTFSEILQSPIIEAYEDDEFYYIRPKPEMYYDLTMWRVDKRTNAVKAILYTEFFSVESGCKEINPRFLKKIDYLAHHGRIGQKWGIQNGPPYPLYRQEKFRSKGSYRKITGQKTRERGKTENKKGGLGLAALSVGVTLAAYGIEAGIYRAQQNKILKRYNDEEVSYAREKVQRVIKSIDNPIQNGFHTLIKPETGDEVIGNTNPWYDTEAGRQNCVNCCFASCLRMRGYDVVASPRAIPRGDDVLKVIKNRKDCVHKASSKDIGRNEKSAASYLKKTVGEQDGMGMITITWDTGGGHAFNWEIKDGNVRFFDAQRNDANFDIGDYFKHTTRNKTLDYIVRLDKADFDWKKLRKYKVIE